MSDYNYTHLLYRLSSSYADQGDECYCDDWYYGVYIPVDCPHPKNPRTIYSKISISVVGNPVKTKPSNSIYNIKIYKLQTTKDEECNELFKDSDLIADFSVEQCSLYEKEYTRLIKTYIGLEKHDDDIIRQTKFKARCAKEKYILSFYLLMNKITQPVKKIVSDNPHVSKRKKKRR